MHMHKDIRLHRHTFIYTFTAQGQALAVLFSTLPLSCLYTGCLPFTQAGAVRKNQCPHRIDPGPHPQYKEPLL